MIWLVRILISSKVLIFVLIPFLFMAAFEILLSRPTDSDMRFFDNAPISDSRYVSAAMVLKDHINRPVAEIGQRLLDRRAGEIIQSSEWFPEFFEKPVYSKNGGLQKVIMVRRGSPPTPEERLTAQEDSRKLEQFLGPRDFQPIAADTPTELVRNIFLWNVGASNIRNPPLIYWLNGTYHYLVFATEERDGVHVVSHLQFSGRLICMLVGYRYDQVYTYDGVVIDQQKKDEAQREAEKLRELFQSYLQDEPKPGPYSLAEARALQSYVAASAVMNQMILLKLSRSTNPDPEVVASLQAEIRTEQASWAWAYRHDFGFYNADIVRRKNRQEQLKLALLAIALLWVSIHVWFRDPQLIMLEQLDRQHIFTFPRWIRLSWRFRLVTIFPVWPIKWITKEIAAECGLVFYREAWAEVMTEAKLARRQFPKRASDRLRGRMARLFAKIAKPDSAIKMSTRRKHLAELWLCKAMAERSLQPRVEKSTPRGPALSRATHSAPKSSGQAAAANGSLSPKDSTTDALAKLRGMLKGEVPEAVDNLKRRQIWLFIDALKMLQSIGQVAIDKVLKSNGALHKLMERNSRFAKAVKSGDLAGMIRLLFQVNRWHVALIHNFISPDMDPGESAREQDKIDLQGKVLQRVGFMKGACQTIASHNWTDNPTRVNSVAKGRGARQTLFVLTCDNHGAITEILQREGVTDDHILVGPGNDSNELLLLILERLS